MAETDPRLVRLVTRHFNDLQGLRVGAVAPPFAVAGAAWSMTRRVAPVMVAGGAAFVVAAFLLAPLDGYYARFGRVKLSAPERAIRSWFGVPTGILLRSQAHTTPGAPSLFWLILSMYPLWLA